MSWWCGHARGVAAKGDASTLLPARAGLGGQILGSDSEDRMAEGGRRGVRGDGGIRRMDGEDVQCRGDVETKTRRIIQREGGNGKLLRRSFPNSNNRPYLPFSVRSPGPITRNWERPRQRRLVWLMMQPTNSSSTPCMIHIVCCSAPREYSYGRRMSNLRWVRDTARLTGPIQPSSTHLLPRFLIWWAQFPPTPPPSPSPLLPARSSSDSLQFDAN